MIKRPVNFEDYHDLYHESLTQSDDFWRKEATDRLEWIRPFKTVSNSSFTDDVRIEWFTEGQLNLTSNCIDRHAAASPDKTAIIVEPDHPDAESYHVTYAQLLGEVSRLANALKTLGVKKGDRVIIYMPMIPQAAYAMLACARIGAVHSVVFGGFSPESLAGRIEDCGASIVITADEGLRGGKSVPLKQNVDRAIDSLPTSATQVKNVLVYKHTDGNINWAEGRDVCYRALVEVMADHCAPEVMDAEDPLFILYTSGSTGRPKGILHTTAGYLLYAAMTHEWVFDYQKDEVFWCTADVGWITGHSYSLYGPLCNGGTTLFYEGVPSYPDHSRMWNIVDKHKVNSFYTAPTAIRALMRHGDEYVTKTDRSSLRILGTVGEPINPEAWRWYNEVVGQSRCPIVDTWWQTETGGHLLTPLPNITPLKPGSATLPFMGIEPVLIDADKYPIAEGKQGEGALCFGRSWPGQMRSIYGDHNRFVQTYFTDYPGYYFSGDGARRDEDGYYWITGRMDDVLNVSGHRLGTAEIESALVAHESVAEAAVVGIAHAIKGQGIYAFVLLNDGVEESQALHKALIDQVRTVIGPIATPDGIQIAPDLPKTRSGKIMRRILRKIAAGETKDFGDTRTLTNPEVVGELVAGFGG